MVTLSCILVTAGQRPAALARALASIRAQRLQPGDEILLAADGEAAARAAQSAWDGAGLPGRIVTVPGGPHGDWGHTPFNHVMPLARGSHLLFFDDDDVYLAGAWLAVRHALAEAADRPHLFRLIHPHHGIIPAEPVLRLANLSTQCLCVPNDRARLGRWGRRYEGDYDFAVSTAALYPSRAWVFSPRVIAQWRHE